MSGGIRPKGSKSYAASRSPEAAEAFWQDQAAQRTLDVTKKSCPKCGSEHYGYKLDDAAMLECYDCGHEEKVKP